MLAFRAFDARPLGRNPRVIQVVLCGATWASDKHANFPMVLDVTECDPVITSPNWKQKQRATIAAILSFR